MAKKKTTRRPNVSAETLERARAELRGELRTSSAVEASATIPGSAAPRVKPISRASVGQSRRLPTAEELRAQYSYVLRDMRNLAILAAALFAFIIAMAFILPQLNM